ncbi:hypothetical protein HDE_03289 [Halotydeus destructor]|nr:hypothetical protein HDE_03289 [Halotydeus destructor]
MDELKCKCGGGSPQKVVDVLATELGYARSREQEMNRELDRMNDLLRRYEEDFITKERKIVELDDEVCSNITMMSNMEKEISELKAALADKTPATDVEGQRKTREKALTQFPLDEPDKPESPPAVSRKSKRQKKEIFVEECINNIDGHVTLEEESDDADSPTITMRNIEKEISISNSSFLDDEPLAMGGQRKRAETIHEARTSNSPPVSQNVSAVVLRATVFYNIASMIKANKRFKKILYTSDTKSRLNLQKKLKYFDTTPSSKLLELDDVLFSHKVLQNVNSLITVAKNMKSPTSQDATKLTMFQKYCCVIIKDTLNLALKPKLKTCRTAAAIVLRKAIDKRQKC